MESQEKLFNGKLDGVNEEKRVVVRHLKIAERVFGTLRKTVASIFYTESASDQSVRRFLEIFASVQRKPSSAAESSNGAERESRRQKVSSESFNAAGGGHLDDSDLATISAFSKPDGEVNTQVLERFEEDTDAMLGNGGTTFSSTMSPEEIYAEEFLPRMARNAMIGRGGSASSSKEHAKEDLRMSLAALLIGLLRRQLDVMEVVETRGRAYAMCHLFLAFYK